MVSGLRTKQREKEYVSAEELSPYEEKILGVIREHQRGIMFEDICAETRLSPDIVVRAVTFLAQQQLITVDRHTSPTDLQLEPVLV